MKSLDEMIAVMQAARDGKQIEFASKIEPENWFSATIVPLLWNWHICDYRIKKDKQRIPLSAADFPPGTVIRDKNIPADWRQINCVSYSGYWAFPWQSAQEFDCQTFMNHFERSLDGGRTWLPCYKEI